MTALASEFLRIGVLGLGRMGLPVAVRLRAAGHHVVGYDPDRDRRLLFGASPAGAAASVDPDRRAVPGQPEKVEPEWAAAVDVLVTVLPGPEELEFAMIGDGGALPVLHERALWIDLTSGDPRMARSLARAAEARGVQAVAAPMAGGPGDAEAGTLGFFVGGEPGSVERAMPVLLALGAADRLERAGDDVGAGHVAKLPANTLWFGQVAAVVEALLIGRAQGVEPERLAAILRRSAGGSVFLDRYLDALLDGDYLETFGIDRVVEELDTVVGLGADADLPVTLTRLVARLHHEALERFGAVDGELLVAKLLEDRAGARLRRSVS
ncbi:NAD(P)-dependent oxidoreductase [Herbiconiux sp. UC225_62]|uniref:NAD(P)-dependent oxidoreductase n=1 Tax=Herbiconiux sp. UC225_62 TaxID=3350168 RepID=UPI0036D20C98